MNDRYLYRAKRTDNGELVEGNLVWSDDAVDDYKAIIIPTTDSNMFTRGGDRGDLGFENWCRVDPSTICQCIGLKDKHGKLIWENDIVRYYDDLADMGKIDRIEWNETYASFVRAHKSQMGLQYLYIDEFIASRCEVIGSAIDNPELLEVGE